MATIYYAVIRERGENWDALLPMHEQKQWTEHASFMNALTTAGFIALGGPLGDGEQKFLIVMVADSPQAAEARLADDPWTTTKMLRIASIERWEILLDMRK